MLANSPLPLPDQCFDSLCGSAWLQNGHAGSVCRFLRNIFGIAQPRYPFAGGVKRAFDELSGAGYADPGDLLESHSYLRLFWPFVGPSSYAAALQDLLGESHRGAYISLVARETARIRTARWYCAGCARADFSRDGFAYARRTHQVVGVDYCAVHQTPLVRPHLYERGAPSAYGLLLSASELRSPMETSVQGLESRPAKVFRIRFATFVHAALEGRIPRLGPLQRRAMVSDRVQEARPTRGEPRSASLRLQLLVQSRAPADWLDRLGFGMRSGTSSNWPALFLNGVAFQEDPIAGLLLAAVLFKDPAEYALHAQCYASVEAGYLPARVRGFPARNRPCVRITLGLLRALLSEPYKLIADKFGLSLPIAASLVNAYPTLLERRRRVRTRRGFEQSKHELLQLVQDLGDQATRTTVFHINQAAFNWVRFHDPSFLDRLLPINHAHQWRGTPFKRVHRHGH